MDEQKALLNEVAAEGYNAADRPFDFIGEGGETVLVCEPDQALREKIGEGFKALGYQITAPNSAKDALKAMRFHVFDVVVLNERFDTADPAANDVLQYLDNLNMTIRRRIFVALVSEQYRTMDNMAAFNRSVNITVNLKNMDDVVKIVKQGVADNRAFFRIYQETLAKMGKT